MSPSLSFSLELWPSPVSKVMCLTHSVSAFSLDTSKDVILTRPKILVSNVITDMHSIKSLASASLMLKLLRIAVPQELEMDLALNAEQVST